MTLKFLLEPHELNDAMAHGNAVLVDITTTQSYAKHHIQGAIFFDYKSLVNGIAPSPGKLPDAASIAQALSKAGITTDKTIIAYDDEGNGKASRLLWTLDIMGFRKLHLINGGLHAHVQSNLDIEQTTNHSSSTPTQTLTYDTSKIADKAFILENISNPDVVIWDARTAEEYAGLNPRASRNGHIPGAVNLNWLETIDMQNALRYKPKAQLIELLNSKGITPDKTIVPHCQTHHRSAHSSVLLNYLGYQQVKAYPGSWSEWGNSTDTPIEK